MELKSTENNEIEIYYDDNLYCGLNGLCRICLERIEYQKCFNIFDTVKPLQSLHISTMIMSCAPIQVINGDKLPSAICENCMSKLHIAWQFKLQCENSDFKLRQYFINLQQKHSTHDPDIINLQIRKEHCLIKNNMFADIAHTPIIQSLNVSKAIQNNIKLSKKTSLEKTTNREQKIHQCDTCGKTFNRREYLTQHIRIHTGEKPYRCHLCEKRFVNSGHLTTHMRTHTGEKPHSCNVCPKAFSTRQELQKHIMVHNGDRPFLCKMCGKSFGSSSNLYSHLKHHTGEKNFTCEYCSKAFYTKQELKQHLVVHTGEKAFLCEFCHKKFSQIAHLKRHSKLHNK